MGDQGALLATLYVRPVLMERILAAQSQDLLICTLRLEVENAFAMHPDSTKTYRTLREHYWWPFMKKQIAEYVSKCLICQQVKAEWQKLSRLLQPLPIPEWKWEHITMDFVFKLPPTLNKHDEVWVVVDRLTKSAQINY
ncbi:hypothetical protein L3X38_025252 [Prunus dulcis]|uniref:Integrase zinc-binding domain-containing protein n=1 Tax=Prunus dulcis TaxID=3755 RepID=A0AAD4W2X4_PRUDU|nr:hypothetical protein L3X38_025252 [Prunus dulcis]